MPQVPQVALNGLDVRRLGFVLGNCLELQAELVFKPIKSLGPALGAADHGGLDDQLLPLPGSAESTFQFRRVLIVRMVVALGDGRMMARTAQSCRQGANGIIRR